MIPTREELFEIWETRLARIRDLLTDFYFAYNFPYETFEKIAKEIIGERGEPPDLVTFNPELAPQDMLFEQAEMIERLPREKRASARSPFAGDQGGVDPHHDQRPARLPEHCPQVVHCERPAGNPPAEDRIWQDRR